MDSCIRTINSSIYYLNWW